MPHTLPIYADRRTITQKGWEVARSICRPLTDAKVGDVVGVIVPFEADRFQSYHMRPIQKLVTYRNALKGVLDYHRPDLFDLPEEKQALLALDLKRLERTGCFSDLSLCSHIGGLETTRNVGHFQLLLTRSAVLIFHQFYQSDLSGEVGQEQVEQSLRVLVPGDLTAHEVLELTPELNALCDMARTIVPMPGDGCSRTTYVLPDLSMLLA